MGAMRIQKEMKAILDVCKNKQKFLKDQEKEMEEQEKADEGDKKADQEKAEKAKKAAAKKDDGKISAMSDKLSETEAALAKAKATIAKLKAAAAAKTAKKDEESEEKSSKKEEKNEEQTSKKEEKSEGEEAPAKKSGKKVKGGSVDVEEESTKHAVIVSAKAKLSGNIKEAEDDGSENKEGKKTIVTATAKHNRETVLEQSVPIHHVGSVEKVDAPATGDEAKETKDGMKKPTVVARGSLV